ncbi:hypothetical protein [Agromyces mangrovi Wang et al. 2018]|uniref:hypothetical protein n=1 Tax=Agromyces mangrovi TaxID=1858653 RepID=UPI002573A88E|nr:hypothetical protein [Agromyces mangrovi]BDZ63463.1 hypothetical protein GCM10025877_04010 [Agromyces mangrovi]
MVQLYLLVYGSSAAGIAVALLRWAIMGRRHGLPWGSVAAWTAAAGLLVVVGDLALRTIGAGGLILTSVATTAWGSWFPDARYAAPLALGALGLVLLAFPVRTRATTGAADLTPRTTFSFTRAGSFIAPLVALAIVLIATLLAGAASRPDPETGHYTMFFVELGGGGGVGTSIYGWYWSLPALTLIAVLLLLALADLALIARPPLGLDRDLDACVRRARSRNVLALVTATLLIHLGDLLGSLAGTVSLRGSFPTSTGAFTFEPTYAVLGPALTGGAWIASALGVAVAASVALTAVPTRWSVSERIAADRVDA